MAILRVFGLPAVLFFALAVHGQLSIFPPGPTTDDAVTLRYADSCLRGPSTVVRNGSEIRVTVGQFRACPSPPIQIGHDVPLGELPAGLYRVTVLEQGGPTRTMTFVVRTAADDALVRLRPWAIPLSGALVHLDTHFETLCGGFDCSTLRVEIEGRVLRIGDLQQNDGTYAFQAPPHSAGPVSMRITNAKGTFDLPAALYYFSPNASEPDPSVFERVLFPVLFSANGQNGSRWRSEVVIVNPTPWSIRNLNTIEPIVCINPPCGEVFEARSRRQFDGEGFPRGAALLMPRGESDDVSFSLRIRDISRDAESYGSQVPVVRERDLYRNTAVPLLAVPLDPRFRTKVRIYAFLDPIYDPQSGAYATVYVGSTPQLVGLTRSCSFPLDCARAPFYGELDLAAGAAGAETDVYVELTEGTSGWAFASVTNNETQQVTIVAPDGKGGRRP